MIPGDCFDQNISLSEITSLIGRCIFYKNYPLIASLRDYGNL